MNRHMTPDELNDRIRESLQVRESPEQLARLEQFCRRRSRAERRGCSVRRTAALAAGVLAVAVLAVASLSMFFRGDEHGPDSLAGGPDSSAIGVPSGTRGSHDTSCRDAARTGELSGPPVSLASRPDETPSSSAGRTPTAYEQLVFAVHVDGPISPQGPRAMAAIEPPANRLARNRAAEEGKQRDEALKAVEQTTDAGRLAQLARETTDRRVRQAALHRLTQFDSETAARSYVALVADGALQNEALAAANAASPAFVQSLVDLLDDKDKTVRRSAALVFGHVDGSEVTESLIARVQENPARSTETWMALVACRGEQTKEFFVTAMSSPRMLGRVNCARLEWARTIP